MRSIMATVPNASANVIAIRWHSQHANLVLNYARKNWRTRTPDLADGLATLKLDRTNRLTNVHD